MTGAHRATPGAPALPRPTAPATAADPAAGTIADGSAADQDSAGGILTSSAIMAAGTAFSRVSGFLRSAFLAAALGASVHADIFTVANTVPNMLYILLAGGVFNAVLVPQLVRTMKTDPDGGKAYVDRIVTLAFCFLTVVTVVLVAAAPLVMRLLLSHKYAMPDMAGQRESAIAFARYCLPQVFFYGMFVLVGQILNARGRFGPMMWAPIANNVISVAVLVAYLAHYGAATPAQQELGFSSSQEIVLGIGSTLGIAAQFLLLLPYLRAAGVRIRPRFDFRGTGLAHTMRLGVWTVLFVIVNQIAYVVVTRLASGGTAAADSGTGITIYSNAFLVVMVPHSIITVSLATAILPRLSRSAAAGDTGALARTLSSTMRTALAVVVPFAAVLPIIALPMAQVMWGHGATSADYSRYQSTLSLFGVGIVFFTVHYLTLRGFYAVERNRTVFFVQCVISVVNIVAAVYLVRVANADDTSAMLVVAYTLAYAIGSAVSTTVLIRLLGTRNTRPWVGYVVRLLLATAIATGITWVMDVVTGDTLWELSSSTGWMVAAIRMMVDLGVLGVVLLALAAPFRLTEVTTVADMLGRRLARR
ncbi:MAG: murein biosynthesis integral membrane protein MurJ [Nocardioidaceae bacterium]|nr:murein biosynthesis integral membrane protein MurJ [Nocardioidaceae bacterium]MCL2612759.1 murein biosynthesis integral membrane protein MurJ [Nocardioidaceae bacterium]